MASNPQLKKQLPTVTGSSQMVDNKGRNRAGWVDGVNYLEQLGANAVKTPATGGTVQQSTTTNTTVPAQSGNYAAAYTAAPTYQQPQAQYRSYDWDDGSSLLTPDSPLTRNVVYQNEFSPASTMSTASDVYNQYYAPMVETQQEQTTQAYRNAAQQAAATAGAAGMATGSRGAVQLQEQANREATAANMQYQQQMYLSAFQNTLDARKLELDNKIQDYANAWREIEEYGYVVTEKTGQLLGITPGQQLTTTAYKTVMSNIAANTASINAQKVQLDQSQQELDQQWANFQEGIRQYEKTFAEQQRQYDKTFAEQQRQYNLSYQLDKTKTDSTIYSRLIDMLSRYDTVTPEMAALGQQVGMSMRVGDQTYQYYTVAERLAQTQAYTDYSGYEKAFQQTQLANSLMSGNNVYGINVSTSGVANAQLFSTLLAQWTTQGLSIEQAVNAIKNSDTVVNIGGQEYKMEQIVGKSNAAKNSAIELAYLTAGVSGRTSGTYAGYQSAGQGFGNVGAGASWGAGIGATIGGALGTYILPGYGTAAGATIGGYVGGKIGAGVSASNSQKKYLQQR